MAASAQASQSAAKPPLLPSHFPGFESDFWLSSNTFCSIENVSDLADRSELTVAAYYNSLAGNCPVRSAVPGCNDPDTIAGSPDLSVSMQLKIVSRVRPGA